MNLALLQASFFLAQLERSLPFSDDRKLYIPWNPAFFEEGKQFLWEVLGIAFNIGLWIFFVISGVYLILKIVDKFSG